MRTTISRFLDGLALEVPEGVLPPWYSSLAILAALSEHPEWLAHVRRVVDVGCGSGVLACWLARRGLNVIALDIDTTAAIATSANASRNGLRVKILVCNLTYCLAAGTVDALISNLPFDPDGSRNHGRLTRALVDAEYRSHRRLLVDAQRLLDNDGRIVLASSPTIGDGDLLRTIIAEEGWAVLDLASTWLNAPTPKHPDKRHLYCTLLLGKQGASSRNWPHGYVLCVGLD
ncbi:MAG: methyltransferase [Chloroflexi bacterium]|nr:methyltransferase [Chloroflexota bacterium]